MNFHEPDYSLIEHASDEAKEVIKACLQKKADLRPSVQLLLKYAMFNDLDNNDIQGSF